MEDNPYTTELTQRIQQKILDLGFELFGIIPIAASKTIDVYQQWIESGYAGQMSYLEKHLEKKHHPQTLLPNGKTLIALAMNYHNISPDPPSDPAAHGVISQYAQGDDYHDIIKNKLRELCAFIETQCRNLGNELSGGVYENMKAYVDTGPILEREYASRAGLGWVGKHSNLIHWKKGSWFFLSELLLSLELDYHAEPVRGSCGTCTRCIEACPTDAIFQDKLIDATRCLSYLNIELKGPIPKEFRPAMGNLIFGCDICQDVCPWNRKAPITQEEAFKPRDINLYPSLIKLMQLDQEAFSKHYKKSPIKRTKRRGFLRNVAIALGNWGNPDAIPALLQGLKDEEALIRGSAAWALGRIGKKHDQASAQEGLEQALLCEVDSEVRCEIQESLEELTPK